MSHTVVNVIPTAMWRHARTGRMEDAHPCASVTDLGELRRVLILNVPKHVHQHIMSLCT